MFFFGYPTIELVELSKRRAALEGMASVYDIAGNVTSPYVTTYPSTLEIIRDTLGSDYKIVISDYGKAVKRVVKRKT